MPTPYDIPASVLIERLAKHLKDEVVIEVSVGVVIDMEGVPGKAHTAGCAAVALKGSA